MSWFNGTPSHSGRKVIGIVVLVVITVIIVIGIFQKTTAVVAINNSPEPTTPTSSTTAPLPSLLPAETSACLDVIDAPPPATTEQDFIDLVWEYETAYMSVDAARWEAVLQESATLQYKEVNRRPLLQTPSAITTLVIPDGSVITWKDNDTKTVRTVSTIACILVKDGERAVSPPYSVLAHYTTWIKSESGWRVDREIDQGG